MGFFLSVGSLPEKSLLLQLYILEGGYLNYTPGDLCVAILWWTFFGFVRNSKIENVLIGRSAGLVIGVEWVVVDDIDRGKGPCRESSYVEGKTDPEREDWYIGIYLLPLVRALICKQQQGVSV